MFVPLRHDPGHAQVDFGEALAVIGGVQRKIHFFAMDLSHSDGCLLQAYPAESSDQRLLRDHAALLRLPDTPYEACEKRAVRVRSLSLVRYRGNDYSVPTADGRREVLVRGYVHEVVIACGAEEIARHPRSYEL